MTAQMLLLSPFFHPEPISTGKYNSFLARTLVQNGVSVDVVCFHPLYPDWRPQRSDKRLSGVVIYRGGTWIRYPKNSLLRRAVLEGGFLLHLLRYAGRMKHYSQIVAVLPPMLFLPLVRIAAGPDIKVTAIVHDLQGIMAGVVLRKGRSKGVCLVRFLEALVLRCCHRVIALSKGMASFLSDCYKIPSSKIAVCWPFTTIDTQAPKWRLGHLFVQDKKHVVYAGALGAKQNPEALISFFLDLVDKRSDVVCHVFSGGPIFEDLKRNREKENQALMFHDLIAERDLYELYLRSDIHVIPEKIGFSKGALPSKLPNLLASGVPILYIGSQNSDVGQVIQRAEAGLCSDSWDLEKLNTLVDRLLADVVDRSHIDRRLTFEKKFARLFSVEALIRELLE